MDEEKEMMEKIMQVEEGDECHHPDPRGLAICVTVKGNPSQWQATAHGRIHEQGHDTNDM